MEDGARRHQEKGKAWVMALRIGRCAAQLLAEGVSTETGRRDFLYEDCPHDAVSRATCQQEGTSLNLPPRHMKLRQITTYCFAEALTCVIAAPRPRPRVWRTPARSRAIPLYASESRSKSTSDSACDVEIGCARHFHLNSAYSMASRPELKVPDPSLADVDMY